ncbi:MAG: serpin [Frankiaceae bacterium]|nr:serpin [Frankiaceae bacterium]
MLATTAAVAMLATACGGAAPVADRPSKAFDLRTVPVSAQQQQLAVADAAFGQALWAALAKPNQNVVASPASIATALQMAYAGARGETAIEMVRTMHLGPNTTPTAIAAAASKLFAQLAALKNDKHSLLRLADEVWLQRDFPIVPDYRAAMATGFDSAFHLADFAGHSEDARKAINAAIAAQTRDRIRDLFPTGFNLANTRLVLTNAIYLKAAWASPFEAAMTKPAAFTRADHSVVHPATMRAFERFDYAATPGYQAVRLPYAGNRLAMTLLLPAAGQPLAWPSATPAFRSQTVELTLPKFRFSWSDDLAKLLVDLGMPAAFSDGADFSGMARVPLHIGAVRHKAFIAVDEKGTEAAAATAVTMDVSSAQAPGPIAHLHFDRPFLFRIDDTATGLPLFLGQVADPTLGG